MKDSVLRAFTREVFGNPQVQAAAVASAADAKARRDDEAHRELARATGGVPFYHGVGLSIPGPFQRYGVWDRSANLPPSFEGFDVYSAYSEALAERAGSQPPSRAAEP